MTFWHILLSIGAAVIVFVLMRGRRGSRINEIDHRQERPNLEVVGEGLEQSTVHTLHTVGKINAVKDVREATGWGLKEAKDYVDELERKYPLPRDRG